MTLLQVRHWIGHVDLSDISQRFMPGLRMERRGEVVHCQGTAIAEWVVILPDGQERGTGTNVYRLGLEGRSNRSSGCGGNAVQNR